MTKSPIRYLGTDGAVPAVPEEERQRPALDIELTNSGGRMSLVDSVIVTVEQFADIRCCWGCGAGTVVDEVVGLRFPDQLQVGQSEERMLHQHIPPGQVGRFQVVLDRSENDESAIVLMRISVRHDGKVTDVGRALVALPTAPHLYDYQRADNPPESYPCFNSHLSQTRSLLAQPASREDDLVQLGAELNGQTPGTSPVAPSPVAPSPVAPSPTDGEQRLIDLLDPGMLTSCTGRPDQEGNGVVAAVNCSAVQPGPTKQPLAVRFTDATAAQTWFTSNTRGIVDENVCVAGQKLGPWTHNNVDVGSLGCTATTAGGFRIVWTIDKALVGIIADGSDGNAMYNWWRQSAYLVPSGD